VTYTDAELIVLNMISEVAIAGLPIADTDDSGNLNFITILS